MRLGVGATVGPYEVLSAAGSGGMGEVYKARDRRLGRIVALKVLLDTHTDRFEREAKAISALNHPNICALYDIGAYDGLKYLVMEWIDGAPLRGPLPIQESLHLAIDIADALATAHREGVVHRDLKPSNILVGKSGLKLLDFGLARFSRMQAAAADFSGMTETQSRESVIVGTLPYMAPEQLEGKPADPRSDIFAFGAVFYEMLTGKPAFEGSSQASLIGAIMQAEPVRVSQLQPLASGLLERIIDICLAKDPDDRWQNVHDLHCALKLARDAAVSSPRPRPRRWLIALPIGCLLAFAAFALAVVYFWAPPQTTVPYRLTVNPPPASEFVFGETMGGSAISPNGRMLAFVAQGTDRPMLWVRSLDSDSAKVLAGTEDAYYPFWSPDCKSLGFFANRKLKKVSVAGAPPEALCNVDRARGGTWNDHGDILFVPGPGPSGRIHRISEDGGPATAVSYFDAAQQEEAHYWPQFLPGGRTFIYFARTSDLPKIGLYVGSLDSPKKKVWVAATGSAGLYVPGIARRSGYLLWCRNQTLLAARFNPGSLKLDGAPAVIADEVGTFGVIGLANFSASASGALIYGTRGLDKIRMTWMSRDGKQIEKFADPGTYFDLSLSADGRRLAFVRTDGLALHVWTTDVDTGVTSRATFGSITQMCPVWSPDGKQIAFMETTRGKRVLFRKQAGGSERELQVTDSPHPQYPTSWSPDGRVLLYYEIDPLTGSDIWAVPLDKPRSPVPLLRTPANEMAAQFSPDGRWVAYQSDDTGRSEVYVQQFQRHGDSVSLADKWQVSTNGGRLPRWRADGSELFYISGNGMLTAVAVERGETSFRFSVARPLFRLPANYVIWRYTYDASPDGRRFLVVGEPDAGELQPLTILLNWQSLLKDR